MRSSPGGAGSLGSSGGIGARSAAASDSSGVAPSNGRRRATISNSMQPSAKMSVRPSSARPWICSGAR